MSRRLIQMTLTGLCFDLRLVLLSVLAPFFINCFLWLDWQTGTNPDASASAASDELQHNGRTFLHWANRKRAHWQHHPVHPQNGDRWLQQPNQRSYGMTPELPGLSYRCRLKSYNLPSSLAFIAKQCKSFFWTISFFFVSFCVKHFIFLTKNVT